MHCADLTALRLGNMEMPGLGCRPQVHFGGGKELLSTAERSLTPVAVHTEPLEVSWGVERKGTMARRAIITVLALYR